MVPLLYVTHGVGSGVVNMKRAKPSGAQRQECRKEEEEKRTHYIGMYLWSSFIQFSCICLFIV